MPLRAWQAGSSLSDIATRAELGRERRARPRYRLTGNKMWISGGEHEITENIVHLVLAKIPMPTASWCRDAGHFAVHRAEEAGECSWFDRADERMGTALSWATQRRHARRPQPKCGWRGTTNTLLNFGEGKFTPAARRVRLAIWSANRRWARLHVPHDERGAHWCGPRGDHAGHGGL